MNDKNINKAMLLLQHYLEARKNGHTEKESKQFVILAYKDIQKELHNED